MPHGSYTFGVSSSRAASDIIGVDMLDVKTKEQEQIEPALSNTKVIKRLDPEQQMNELLNIVKLVYMDTERTMQGIRAELDIYDSIIARTFDEDLKDRYRLQQAQAAQKPAVSSKLLSQLISALDRMRTITDAGDKKTTDTQIVFVDDMEASE